MNLLKRIGFDRPIQMEWLDETVRLYSEKKDVDEIKDLLNNYLEDEVRSNDNRRKTVNILANCWVNVNPEYEDIRDIALGLWLKSDDSQRIAMHWSMLLLAYPIFFDIAESIGKLFSLQDEFSTPMVKRRIYEKWGKRSTLEYAIGRIIRSIRDWGIIEQGEKHGLYKKNGKIDFIDKDIQVLLLKTYLIASQKNRIDYANIGYIPALFPFHVDIKLNDIQDIAQFKINNMGGNLIICM